jgi:ADP-ribose pyrophosphatase YjhB (NUDIX family)
VAAASDISWSGPSGTFNLRVAAVIRRGDDILLCTVDGLGYWFLPGGRARFGQPGDAALARELAEELGHQLRVGDLAFVVENIFADDGSSTRSACTTTSPGRTCSLLTICGAGASWVIDSAG